MLKDTVEQLKEQAFDYDRVLNHLRAYCYYEVTNTYPESKQRNFKELVDYVYKLGYVSNPDPKTW
jgi:hypothetical protein